MFVCKHACMCYTLMQVGNVYPVIEPPLPNDPKRRSLMGHPQAPAAAPSTRASHPAPPSPPPLHTYLLFKLYHLMQISLR